MHNCNNHLNDSIYCYCSAHVFHCYLYKFHQFKSSIILNFVLAQFLENQYCTSAYVRANLQACWHLLHLVLYTLRFEEMHHIFWSVSSSYTCFDGPCERAAHRTIDRIVLSIFFNWSTLKTEGADPI
jgi:hypothetical protein